MQLNLVYPLTDFEQATLEQLISYKCKDESDIPRLMNDQKNIDKARELVSKWITIRKDKKLKPYR